MEPLLVWIRDHPQIAAIGFVLIVLVRVLTVLGILMQRAGARGAGTRWFDLMRAGAGSRSRGTRRSRCAG